MVRSVVVATLLVWMISGIGVARAVPPSEKLLPTTTKGLLSVPDVDHVLAQWSKTQLGQLVEDPAMKPFVEDLQNQLQSKLSKTGIRLGITWEDLEGVYGGEVAMAVAQPGDQESHAIVLMVDITNRATQAQELLTKVETKLLERQAVKGTAQVQDLEVISFTVPLKRDPGRTFQVFYSVHNDVFIATDSLTVLEGMLSRLVNGTEDGLDSTEAFATVMARCRRDADELQEGDAVDIRWFIEPFGYGEVTRAAAGGKKRGQDLLAVLRNQGFAAIKGIGGHIQFATGEHEIVYRTMVFAPGDTAKGDTAAERFSMAARVLDFPNGQRLNPQDWVPRNLANYFTFNWRMKESFEHSKSLVNELLGSKPEEDLFEDILGSLATDKDGPRIDIRKDLIQHLGDRATMIADHRLPITTESERVVVAVELINPEAVARTVHKAMDVDPDARPRDYNGHIIWEILEEAEVAEVPELQIGDGDALFDNFAQEDEPQAGPDEAHPLLPNSAVSVMHGHLLLATHVDILVDLLDKPAEIESLAAAADYQLIDTMLQRLGSGEDSFRMFTRTDAGYRPSYELLREGKMPEAKTLMGRLLNRLLGPEEEGVLREQQIDASKLPEFQVVRRYLGPAGMFVRTERDGWFCAGALLNKQVEAVAEKPTLDTVE